MITPRLVGVLAFVSVCSLVATATMSSSAAAATAPSAAAQSTTAVTSANTLTSVSATPTVTSQPVTPVTDTTKEPAQQPVAEADQQTSIQVDVTPLCSSASKGQAFWQVNNKNDVPVTITWTNTFNNVSGTFVAPAHLDTNYQLVTSYDASDANNTTTFAYSNKLDFPPTQTNATKAACEEVPPTCVDGTDASNFKGVIERLSQTESAAAIVTKSGLPVCNDVTLYFSSYLMPDNYDGRGFFPNGTTIANPTAYSQTVFASTKLVITKGENAGIVSVALPADICKNIQVDLYYSPEITTIGANGTGTQNIASEIYLKDTGCDQTNPGGGNGGGTTNPGTPGKGSTTPPAPVTPVVAPTTPALPVKTAPVVTELPHTGPSDSVNLLPIGIVLAGFVYLLSYVILPRKSDESSL